MSIIKWKESYRVARQKKGNYNKIGNDTVPLMIQTQETKRDSVDQSRYPSERWKGEDFWVSHFNYDPEVLGRIHFPEEVIFHDVTLRDGEQTLEWCFERKRKLTLLQCSTKWEFKESKPACQWFRRKISMQLEKLLILVFKLKSSHSLG